MKLQILGTAAAEGWPALYCTCDWCKKARQLGGKDIRTRSGAMIDDRLMIDFSADTYMHALKYNLDMTYVDTLLVTHDHEDHFYAMDLCCRYPGFGVLDDTAPKTLTVYGNDRVGLQMRHARPEMVTRKDGPVAFRRIIPFQETEVAGGYTFTALMGLHDRSQQCYIYLLRDKQGKTMLYGHDTGYFPQETMDHLKGIHLDLAMLDCTCCALREATNHMGIEDCFEMKRRLAANGNIDETTQLVLTHFSHNGHMMHSELEEMGAKEGFTVAYDGVIYTI